MRLERSRHRDSTQRDEHIKLGVWKVHIVSKRGDGHLWIRGYFGGQRLDRRVSGAILWPDLSARQRLPTAKKNMLIQSVWFRKHVLRISYALFIHCYIVRT